VKVVGLSDVAAFLGREIHFINRAVIDLDQRCRCIRLLE